MNTNKLNKLIDKLLMFILSEIIILSSFIYLIDVFDMNFVSALILSILLAGYITLKNEVSFFSMNNKKIKFTIILLVFVLIIGVNLNKEDISIYNNFVTNNLIVEGKTGRSFESVNLLIDENLISGQNYIENNSIINDTIVQGDALLTNKIYPSSIYYALMHNHQTVAKCLLGILCVGIFMSIIDDKTNKKIQSIFIVLFAGAITYASRNIDLFIILIFITNLNILKNRKNISKYSLYTYMILVNSIYLYYGNFLIIIPIINCLIFLLDYNTSGIILLIGLIFCINNRNYIYVNNSIIINQALSLLCTAIICIYFAIFNKIEKFNLKIIKICLVLISAINIGLFMHDNYHADNKINMISAKELNGKFKPGDIIFYEESMKPLATEIVQNTSCIAIPFRNIIEVNKTIDYLDKSVYYLGENVNGENSINLNIDNCNGKITSIENNTDESIYPSETNIYSGMYSGGGWTDGDFQILTNVKVNNNRYLILETTNDRNPLIDRNNINLNVFINNIKLEIDQEKTNKEYYYFKIPSTINEIKLVKVKTNVFIPKDEGINGDGRTLGINIKKIYIN